MLYPYVITINVYNSAGEVVKTVASMAANALITDAKLSVNGVETENMILGDGEMTIYLPGVESPATLGQGGSVFTWDGENDQAQDIPPGVYFMKVEEIDPYGHVHTITKQINAIDGREYVELNVFNAAGELVRKQRQYGTDYSGYGLSIDMPDLITIKPGADNSVSIKYTNNASDVLLWDGMTGEGTLVSNGIYEIQVIVKDDIRGLASAAKSVTVLRESETYLGEISVVPNPYTKDEFYLGGIEIRWDFGTGAAVPGNVRVSVYNAAGNLVRVLAGALQAGAIKWDLLNAAREPAAGGLYIVVVEGINAAGHLERKTQKLAVIRGINAK